MDQKPREFSKVDFFLKLEEMFIPYKIIEFDNKN